MPAICLVLLTALHQLVKNDVELMLLLIIEGGEIPGFPLGRLRQDVGTNFLPLAVKERMTLRPSDGSLMELMSSRSTNRRCARDTRALSILVRSTTSLKTRSS